MIKNVIFIIRCFIVIIAIKNINNFISHFSAHSGFDLPQCTRAEFELTV